MKTTSVILSVFLIANVWRAWGFVQYRDVMAAYGATANPAVLAMEAGVWAAVFLTLLIALWRKMAILRWIIPIMLLIYAIWMAVQPAPSLPLTVWHLFLILMVSWRLQISPQREQRASQSSAMR